MDIYDKYNTISILVLCDFTILGKWEGATENEGKDNSL